MENRIVCLRFHIAAAIALLSVSCAEAKAHPHPRHHAPKVAWQTYHNNDLSFQMKVPKGWSRHLSGQAVGFVHQTKTERIAVGVLKSAHEGLTLEDEAAQQFESQGRPKRWAQSYTTLGGKRALKIVVSSDANKNVKMVQYLVETAQGRYLIQCIAPRQAWFRYNPIFHTAVQSFKPF